MAFLTNSDKYFCIISTINIKIPRKSQLKPSLTKFLTFFSNASYTHPKLSQRSQIFTYSRAHQVKYSSKVVHTQVKYYFKLGFLSIQLSRLGNIAAEMSLALEPGQ